MAKIIWDNSNNTGIKEIDGQHQHLCSIFNNLNIALENGSAISILTETINEIIKYTDYHFTAEENYMKETNFKEFEHHKTIHKEFENKVQKLKNQINNNDEDVYLAVKTTNLVWEWFVNHIKEEDMRYVINNQ